MIKLVVFYNTLAKLKIRHKSGFLILKKVQITLLSFVGPDGSKTQANKNW